MVYRDINNRDRFVFKGFFPNDNLKEKCREMYQLFETRSPSQSTKEASITKIGDNYEAKLKIISGSVNFEIISKETKPAETIKQLHKEFIKKILNWNKERNTL